MSRLFLDTNIVLDLLGEREPFYEPIAKLATLADKGKVKLIVAPITFTTVNYVLGRLESYKIAVQKLRKFKIITEICNMTEAIIEKGLHSKFPDFEDAVQYYCAVDADCTTIITRNGKDFKKSTLPVMTASEYLKSIKTDY